MDDLMKICENIPVRIKAAKDEVRLLHAGDMHRIENMSISWEHEKQELANKCSLIVIHRRS